MSHKYIVSCNLYLPVVSTLWLLALPCSSQPYHFCPVCYRRPISLTSLASTPPPPPPPTNHPFQTKKVCIYLIKIKFWPLPTYQCIYHFLALACSVFFKVVLWLLNSPRSNFSIWIFVAQFSYFWCYLQWCLFKIKLTSIRIFLFLYCIIKHDDHNMYICESVKQKKKTWWS